MCVQQRFLSVCTATQSDQSLSFTPEEMLDACRAPIEDTDQTDLSLQWVHQPTCTFCWTPDQIWYFPIYNDETFTGCRELETGSQYS